MGSAVAHETSVLHQNALQEGFMYFGNAEGKRLQDSSHQVAQERVRKNVSRVAVTRK